MRLTQPYRQLGPAMLAAVIPAAVLLGPDFSREGREHSGKNWRPLLLLLSLLMLPRIARTALHYLPLLPDARADLPSLAEPWERPVEFKGHSGPPAEYQEVRDYLVEHHHGERVAVLDWMLAEYLAAVTDLPILGGIPQRFVSHVDAHPLRHDFHPGAPGEDTISRYLATYAVGFVVTYGDFGPIDERRDLIEPALGAKDQRVYRTKRRPSYFLAGAGQLLGQGMNSLRLQLDSPEATLSFHWMETLECRPDCTLERVPVARDRVGFIRVVGKPGPTEVFHSYDLDAATQRRAGLGQRLRLQ